MSATATKTKIPAVHFRLERVEGLASECFSVEVESWEEADKTLLAWARTAPGKPSDPEVRRGCYDKCDFLIVWKDGEDYEGRFDLMHPSTGLDLEGGTPLPEGILAGHVLRHLRFLAGLWCPAHMKRPDYEKFVAGEPGRREKCRETLETYEIGRTT